MSFNIDDFSSLLPPELTSQKKRRLNDALKQFHSDNKNQKYYTDFYSSNNYSYFLQGDLIYQLRFPQWDSKNSCFEKVYHDVILISNTCDMDESNPRDIPKQVMIAKLIDLQIFHDSLKELEIDPDPVISNVKNQQFSNLIYLPSASNNVEYIAYLDEISSISIYELMSLKSDIYSNRIAVLDHFGYYLFIFKLSYHLNRLPEEIHR